MAQLGTMIETVTKQKLSVAFLVISGLAAAGALVLGIDDNPRGLLLLYGAVASFILAFAHRWRSSRSFFLLLGGSFLGFVVFAILHNLLYALGEMNAGSWIAPLLEGFHVVSFLLAILICPPGILIGLIGYFVAGFRKQNDEVAQGCH